MGVRFLIGEADGTSPAACLYDSVSGVVFGPLVEAPDAAEQAEAFVRWIADGGPRALPYRAAAGRDGTDARHWADSALMKLYAAWRRQAVDTDTGLLHEAGKEAAP